MKKVTKIIILCCSISLVLLTFTVMKIKTSNKYSLQEKDNVLQIKNDVSNITNSNINNKANVTNKEIINNVILDLNTTNESQNSDNGYAANNNKTQTSTKHEDESNQESNSNNENELPSNNTDTDEKKDNNTTDDSNSDKEEEKFVSTYDGSLGTVGSLKGNTVIVSIFANDPTTKWNNTSEEDNNQIAETLKNLNIATNWLETQASRYNSNAKFIYDWSVNKDLKYEANFEQDIVTWNGYIYYTQQDYIDCNIKSEELKNKYKADNILYLFFLNTEYSNTVRPWSMGHSNDENFYVEYSNIYIKFDNYFDCPPATYAHEIMHSFGAHDLYYANEYINQDFVDYCNNICSNDIMYSVSMGDTIYSDFTALDAYYVGLINSSTEKEHWKLANSEHIK